MIDVVIDVVIDAVIDAASAPINKLCARAIVFRYVPVGSAGSNHRFIRTIDPTAISPAAQPTAVRPRRRPTTSAAASSSGHTT